MDRYEHGGQMSYRLEPCIAAASAGWTKGNGSSPAGMSLRLRRLWFRRTDPTRPWTSLLISEDHRTMAFFKASDRCILGNGELILFWCAGAVCYRPCS
jgi:hypothetical protein